MTTLSDQMNNETTSVPKGEIIISGVEGEQWLVTKTTFTARYEKIKTFATLSQDGMPHGTCHAKKELEARAIRMKWKFEVYYNNSDHPERGQEGWYLLQNQEEGQRGYTAIHPKIFDQIFEHGTNDGKKDSKSAATKKPESKSAPKPNSDVHYVKSQPAAKSTVGKPE